MKADDTPDGMPVPFAVNGQRNVIAQSSQISVTKGAASFNDGFPPLTMTPVLQGGVPPFGKDMNGILYLLSQAARWAQAGGAFTYNPAFATDPNVGGYPRGAVLLRADGQGFWFNLADDNETNPDATDGSVANWLSLNPDWNAVSGPSAILNRPDLATVATSGQYEDLIDPPIIPAAPVNADWNATSGLAQILHRPQLATVATSGKYADLSGTPTIPAAQVNSDWNATSGVAQILNKPSSLAGSASGLYIELGYAGTRGIDMGNHYELDFSTATNTFGGFQFTLNSDNSISVPTGLYLVDADAEILAPVEDQWQVPAQVTFSVCVGYGYPGVYQQAVRRFPDLPLGTQMKGGILGSLVIAGPLSIGEHDHVWAGFTKVLGANTQTPLMLRGHLSLAKVA